MKVANSKFKNFEKDLVTNALFLRKNPFSAQKWPFISKKHFCDYKKSFFLTIYRFFSANKLPFQ
jgi:hypothetical protein